MDLANNCSLSDTFWSSASAARFFRLNVLMPIYIVAGLIGHTIFIIAVYKQSKKEAAFAYQLFSLSSEMCEIITFSLYIFSRQFSGVAGPGYQWYWTNVTFMWYSAYLAIPLANVNILLTLCLMISAAGDRLFVLISPARYQKINNYRQRQMLVLAVSAVISVTLNVYHGFLYKLDSDMNHSRYVIVTNTSFITAHSGAVLAFVCNMARMTALITLITCNALIIVKYRYRFKKIQLARQQTTISAEFHKKPFEKTLILMTCCESFCTSVYTGAYTIFYALVYATSRFNNCEAFLFGPIADCLLIIMTTIDFYAILIISKQFRTMVKNVFLRKKPHQAAVKRIAAGGQQNNIKTNRNYRAQNVQKF